MRVLALMAALLLPSHGQVAVAAPPPNDAFAAPTLLAGDSGVVLASNFAASTEHAESLPTAPGLGATIWFRWSAPANGLLELRPNFASQPLVLTIAKDAPVDSLVWLASNAHRVSTHAGIRWRLRDSLSIPVRQGETFVLAIDTLEPQSAAGSGLSIILPDILMPIGPLDPDGDPQPVPQPPIPPPGGDVQFSYQFVHGPANDDFENPAILAGSSIAVPASNFAATRQPTDPDDPGSPGGASVWYSWTAPASGRVSLALSPPPPLPQPAATVSVPAQSAESIFFEGGGIDWLPAGGGEWPGGQNPGFSSVTISWSGGIDSWNPWFEIDLDPLPIFAPILSVYTGENRRLLGRGENLEFQAEAGRAYFIAFEGARHTYGAITFHLVQTPPPANDNFENAVSFQNASRANLSGHLVSASRQTGEPVGGPDFSGGTAWFHWKASTFGATSLQMNPAPPNSIYPLSVYSGSNLQNLSLRASSLNGAASFFSEPDSDYWIAVSAGAKTPGEFSLELTGPVFRVLESSVAKLVRDGFVPRFHGLRGQTALLYAKTDAGWRCVEIEPIRDFSATFVNPIGLATGGLLKIVTIDEAIPAPRVEFQSIQGSLLAVLRGHPGQRCDLATSNDLSNWQPLASLTLSQAATPLAAPSVPSQNQVYWRVSQSFPTSLLPARNINPVRHTSE